jgi:hypothetical protein
MTAKRLTKEDIRNTSGILNPVDHVILAFENDDVTTDAAAALRAAGSAEQDILSYRAEEATPRLRERVREVSGAAGFGYEIILMRRYLSYAEQGAGWMIVYAPDEAAVRRIVDVARRFNAKCAVRYHRLANEDLI